MEEYKTIKYPLATEKSIRLMESENKLIFVVAHEATKTQIKSAVEKMFKVKVVKVNTYIQGKLKKAYVKFSAATPAIDIATNMGII